MPLRRLLLCLLMTVVPMCTSGCFDRKELEQQAFVTLLGIDKGPGGTLDVTFDLAQPQNPSGGGQGGPSSKAGTRVTVRAHSLTEAITVANTGIERTLSLTHLTLLLFGQDLAQEGLGNVMQSLTRYREFRGTILLGVAQGAAKDTIAAFSPMLEKSPSRAAESIALVGQQMGMLPVTYLHDFTRSLQVAHQDGIMPLFAVNQSVEQDPKGEQGLQQKDVGKMLAGSLPRSGGDPVEWCGTAVFHGDKMVDTLNGNQTRYVELMSGKVKRTMMTFRDPVHPDSEHVGMNVRVEHNPEFRVSLGNPMKITVTLPLEGDVLSTQNDVDYSSPVMRKKLENSVAKEANDQIKGLLEQLLVKDNADIIPISNVVRKNFATHAQFVQYPWEQRLQNAQLNVQSELHVRRYGIEMIPLNMNQGNSTDNRTTNTGQSASMSSDNASSSH